MTGSRFPAKSETREFAERDRMTMNAFSSLSEETTWRTSNGAFLIALVAAGVFLALLALALR